MRDVFDTVPMKGTVVIGEGEMDEAPMLYIGEKLGTGYGPRSGCGCRPFRRDRILLHLAAGMLLLFWLLRIMVIFFMLQICIWKRLLLVLKQLD